MTDRVAIVDESRSVRTPDLPGGHGSGDYARSATRLPLGGNGSSNERRNRSCARDPPAPNRVRLKILLYRRPAPRLTCRDRRRNGRRRWALPRSW
jgi:hypothetical protein